MSSPSIDQDSRWVHEYIRAAVQKHIAEAGPEIMQEPSRAFWHLGWNSRMMASADSINEDYRTAHGRDAPSDLQDYARRILTAYYTNPYPGEMVSDRTGFHLGRTPLARCSYPPPQRK